MAKTLRSQYKESEFDPWSGNRSHVPQLNLCVTAERSSMPQEAPQLTPGAAK